MPHDPELLAEACRRGIIPQERGWKDPELLAEARRRGIFREEPLPSLGERFMAGLGQRDIQQPEGFERGDIAEFIGREGLPAIGGAIGATGGPVGAAAGAAIGRLTQKGIARGLGIAGEETGLQTVGDVLATGALQGVFQAAVPVGRATLASLRPGAIKLGAQILRAGPGIKEKTGRAVLSDLGMLSRAPSIKKAGEVFEEMVKGSGLKSGPQGTRALTGKMILGPEKKLELLNEALEELERQALTPQKAIIARQQTAKLLQSARFGDPAMAAEKRELTLALGQLDEFLEPRVPGYDKAMRVYHEAKAAEEFKSILPLNINLSPNILRSYTAYGAAGAGLMAGVPQAALLPLGISPYVSGLAIRGAHRLGQVGGALATTRLPELGARAGISGLAEYYNRRP